MFAIIRVGGKQYRVENGTQVLVDRLHVEPGSPVEGVEVLMLVDGDDTKIGAPTVDVEVGATAVRHHLGKKIRVFKYKAKKNYRRRIGSRPHQTLIRIDSIGGNSERNQSATKSAPVATATPSAPATQTAPVTEMAPAPAMAPVAEVTPVVEMAPEVVVVETPMVAEVATVAETPVVIEVAPGVEAVAVVETPVVAEVPVVVETPVVIETETEIA